VGFLKFTVTGVYSSAISKMLLENGHEPTRLSNTLVQRLGIAARNDEPDVVIKDMSRWQGVVLIGDGAKVLADEITDKVKQSAMFYLPKVYGAIYKARILEKVRNGFIVDLDGRKGLLKTKLYETEIMAVQVTGYARSVSKLLVTDTLRVRAGGSEAIRLSRGRMSQPDLPAGWKWKKNGSEEDRKAVSEKARDVEEMVSSPEVPEGRCIAQGVDYVELVFGYDAKKVLDEWRRKLVPTMNGHHYLKSLGPEYSALVEFAERVQPFVGEQFEQIVKDTLIKGVYPRSTEEIKIFHMKPNGVDVEQSPAYVLHSDEKTIITKRRIRSSGKYDGLNAEKSPGDYAITEFRIDEWFEKTTYYRRDGSEIGVYANISTPPEVSKTFIRYIDLYIDVVRSGENVSIIDQDELERAYKNGHINEYLYQKAIEMAQKVAEELKTKKL
jgi:protein associated with RNAse G/E